MNSNSRARDLVLVEVAVEIADIGNSVPCLFDLSIKGNRGEDAERLAIYSHASLSITVEVY